MHTIEKQFNYVYLLMKRLILKAREWDKTGDWDAKDKQLDEDYRIWKEKLNVSSADPAIISSGKEMTQLSFTTKNATE